MKKIQIILLLMFCAGIMHAQPVLKYRSDSTFKIVQLTDMHIDLESGKSEICFQLIADAIRYEKPDLIVFTGDQVIERNPEKAWERLINQMQESGVLWTMVFGNHDHEQGMTREEIYAMVKKDPHCLMDSGNVKGVGNYILPIESAKNDQPATMLYFFDSHANCELSGVGGYQWIDFSQIDWFIRQSGKNPVPSLVFMHIPLPEYREASEKKITGVKEEDICNPRLNSGLFTALKESGKVMGVFAGHDHENDFIGEHLGIALAYGRVSAGTNAYGDLEPGMRVIVLKEGKQGFETYIRLKDGKVMNHCSFPEFFK